MSTDPEPPLSLARKRPRLRRSEQIAMAAEFLDKAIGQIFIAIAVLDSHGSDPVARNAVIRMLRNDVANDLDAASKIFEAEPPQSRSLLKRFLNWLSPVRTHCERCGDQLPEPSRVGICQDCSAW